MSQTAMPHNRLGIDYRNVPPRRISLPTGIIDAHTHVHGVDNARTFLQAADAYGIGQIWTMAPLEDIDALNAAFPNRFRYIAVPQWQKGGPTEEFANDWMHRLDAFYEKGARLFKLHMAPGTRKRWQLDFHHPIIHRITQHAYNLGYHFMTHVGDPLAWFHGTGKYADGSHGGSFENQFTGLDQLLEQYPDRIHMGAHMGGSLEDLPALTRRMEKFPHYIIDSSATKWIVRAIAEGDPAAIKAFILRFQDRILFGSDLVVADKYDFDHYASRYWTHLHLWETDYRDQSPIEDPDAGKGFNPQTRTFDTARADGTPRLVGLNLPPDVLTKLYRTNAQRWLPVA